jgi:copper chaperone CopZ
MRALDSVREVYGVRRLQFDEKSQTVRVEFDASRLSEEIVARLLREAGLDVREKLALA